MPACQTPDLATPLLQPCILLHLSLVSPSPFLEFGPVASFSTDRTSLLTCSFCLRPAAVPPRSQSQRSQSEVRSCHQTARDSPLVSISLGMAPGLAVSLTSFRFSRWNHSASATLMSLLFLNLPGMFPLLCGFGLAFPWKLSGQYSKVTFSDCPLKIRSPLLQGSWFFFSALFFYIVPIL